MAEKDATKQGKKLLKAAHTKSIHLSTTKRRVMSLILRLKPASSSRHLQLPMMQLIG